jgi:hypothetical protein
MNRILDILNNYTDTELAYLNKFRLDNYLPETQTKIKEYILEIRGLKPKDLDDLISKNVAMTHFENKLLCPRCKSDKIGKDSHSNNEYNIFCAVCSFIFQDPKLKNQESRENLKDIFFDFLSDLDY